MDALNTRTKHSAQRFHIIYSNVLLIILYSLYDRLTLHMLHTSVLSFSKWFQSYFKHFKTIMSNSAHLKCLWRNNAIFIGLKISLKFSYRGRYRYGGRYIVHPYYYFDLCLGFRLYYVYFICICIFNVIWQLNALNGFSFQLLIYAISAIKNIIFLKRKLITCSF